MARKYDWEAQLTPSERINMDKWAASIESLKFNASIYQEARDKLRREAVGRARNAILKQERQAK